MEENPFTQASTYKVQGILGGVESSQVAAMTPTMQKVTTTRNKMNKEEDIDDMVDQILRKSHNQTINGPVDHSYQPKLSASNVSSII